MAKYMKQMQHIVSLYRLAGEPWPAASKAIGEWAIKQRLWELPESAALARCAEDISRAMREEYMTDPKGRRVRVKHPATVKVPGGQMVLWDDMRTASPEHMRISFQQRRQQIVGDCRQLKVDVDSYNDQNSENPPIQMVFDFTMDLAELEAAA
ncbi:MAG: hypothetical protein HOM52_11005 [Rhodospirillaceae bacterium]|jgi:hypothetical protein|nr:hypothetical protein [Nitrospinaceae bacterium]MBT4427326.1 hypothetical protein [Rhodospirillaceae bacterium]MBT5039029.1 hypothetical protein [Rhodospirillaceae bacterium]MBT5676195.1 hypothetical protein [Rhodospirillaceae bacterium]MBT5778294.1 hypothetical protein [Rhodospirillaceae bacterium]